MGDTATTGRRGCCCLLFLDEDGATHGRAFACCPAHGRPHEPETPRATG